MRASVAPGVTGEHGLDHRSMGPVGACLEDVAVRSQVERRIDEFRPGLLGQEDDLRRRRLGTDVSCGLDAVHRRQPDIEQCQIGQQIRSRMDRGEAIGDGDDVHVGPPA